MRVLLAAALFASGAAAQSFQLGTAADPCIGGSAWATPPLRYGTFTCNFSVTPGLYSLAFGFHEPSVTVVGARRFSVLVNNTPAVNNLDLVASGATDPTIVITCAAQVYAADGRIAVQVLTLVRSGVLSTVTITPTTPPPPVTAVQPFALSATPSTATVACANLGCRAGIGEKVYSYPTDATAAALAGSGAPTVAYFYVDGSGVLCFGYDGAAVSDATVVGFAKVSGVTNYPPNVQPIGHCDVSGNQFGACTDDRAWLSRLVIDQGFGITVLQDPQTGHTKISINPAVVQLIAQRWQCQGGRCAGVELYQFADGRQVVAVPATPEAAALPACPAAGPCWQVVSLPQLAPDAQ